MLGAAGDPRARDPGHGHPRPDPQPPPFPPEPPVADRSRAALEAALRPLPGAERPRGRAQPEGLPARLQQVTHRAGEAGPPLFPSRRHRGDSGGAAARLLSA